jgi:hydrogenase expression/formation protein HypE
MTDTITMAHGAGGKQTSELIHGIFESTWAMNISRADDAAVLPPVCGRLAMTTDGFIVSPQFFPRRQYRKAQHLRHGQRSLLYGGPVRCT